jgi:predicted nucleic-acid-binding Zn-ribbon protein
MKYNTDKIVLQPLLFIIMVHLLSCSTGACFDETEARVKAGFYSKATGLADAPDSISLFGVNMDTLTIYDKYVNPKTVEFPLYAESTECKLVLRINGMNDTVTFTYNSYTALLSKECGYTFFFNLDTVIYSKNIIDSISVTKKSITTFNEENMRIFY